MFEIDESELLNIVKGNIMQNHENLWYKNAIFYQIYPRSFFDSNGDGYGDFQGIIQKLDYVSDLGVDCIWIMPTYSSPLKDDGYDISDFYSVYEPFGTLEDLQKMFDEIHKRGMKVITDLVLNHCSDQHPWFQEARKNRQSKYRDYFVWSDSDQKYSETRIIFVDSQKSNWTWDDEAGQYYWHRFYPSQPDLNYDNPEVREEMKNVMRYWLKMGIDGFRADAVPYLFEREGTINENLPETHAYLKELRKMMDDEFPGTILLCEANQWPKDVREYFGEGDEFHLGFHFPLMPRIFKSIGQQDASSLVNILKETPDIPENCQWCNFLRNHDELTLEMVSEEDRQWMWNFYAPDREMRMNLGIRRRLYPLLENDRRKIGLAYSLMLTLPGSPVLYYGDEIGMGDDIRQFDRNGVRTPMQWDDSPNGGFSTSKKTYLPVIDNEEYGYRTINVKKQQENPDSNLNWLKHLIRIRKSSKALGTGNITWLNQEDSAIPVLAYRRQTNDETIIMIHNMTENTASIDIAADTGIYQDLLQPSIRYRCSDAMIKNVQLKPREFFWLKKEK